MYVDFQKKLRKFATKATTDTTNADTVKPQHNKVGKIGTLIRSIKISFY